MRKNESNRNPSYQLVALKLSFVTVAYNLFEGLVSVLFAELNGSPALLGFGIDSFVESLSGTVMIWRFSHPEKGDEREPVAIQLVGVSLMVLGIYVGYEAAAALYYGEPPNQSIVGVIVAALSLMCMPMLYVLKRRTAETTNSRSLAADAKQTLACALLSIALLIGTGLHYAVGAWQADPVAGLLIAAYLVREGHEALTERRLCG